MPRCRPLGLPSADPPLPVPAGRGDGGPWGRRLGSLSPSHLRRETGLTLCAGERRGRIARAAARTRETRATDTRARGQSVVAERGVHGTG